MFRKYNCLALAMFFIIACDEPKDFSGNAAIEAEINTFINNWHKAAKESDFEGYFGALEDSSVFIGTDATENWKKAEFINFSKPFFNRPSAWDFMPLDRNVYISEAHTIAWFNEILKTWMGTCIGSGVLEKQGSTWKIKHYVLSIAVPNDDLNEVIKLKSQNDSIFQLKYQFE